MLPVAIRVLLALFYAYGAVVHVLNMLSLTGFDWAEAPLRWQVLDVVYLLLDVLVVYGLLRARAFGTVALIGAACSQVVLYTVLREWILDVPPAFAVTEEQRSYLDGLVAFHVVTLLLVTVSWRRKRQTAEQ